ncbi:hypothetical protein [Shewanella sp. GXUN23E]|uniref:hypothetical protein n=1 Tax=Shewanella sp. GXUN23E TaxID=3422498 RepID=UPI003D7C8440
MRKTTLMLALLATPLMAQAQGCITPNRCSSDTGTACTIALSDWGVSPGNTDNSSCMQNAVDFGIAQSASKAVNLQFGTGTYQFESPVTASVKSKHSDTNYNFNSSRIAIAGKTSANPLTIQGNGIDSTIVEFVGFNQDIGGTPTGLNGLSVYSSNNVDIKDLSFTYDKYPFSQGVLVSSSISSKSDDTVTITLDSGYDAPQQFINEDKDKSYIVTFNGDQTYEKVPSDLKFTAARHLNGSDYELSGLDQITRDYLYDYHRVNPNLKVALSPKIGGETLYFFNSSNIKAKNINISNAPAVAVRGQNGGSNITLDNVNYKRRKIEGSADPLMAGTAGGYIFQSIRGGLTIKNCEIDHNADDTLGLFARGTDLLRVSGNTVDVDEKKAQFLSVSDIVDIYDAGDSSKKDKNLQINAIEHLNDGNIRLTLSKNIINSVVGDYIGSRSATIGVSGNPFLVENNTLANNKGRAIRSNASFGEIKNNTVSRNGNGGIWLGGDAEHNSQCNESVSVTNNIAKQQLHGPAILVYNAIKNNDSTLKCNKALTITGNTIEEQARTTPAIFIDNTSNSTIQNNNFISEFGSDSVIKDVLYDRLRTSGISSQQRNQTVVLSNYAKGLTVSGNTSGNGKPNEYLKTTNTQD